MCMLWIPCWKKRTPLSIIESARQTNEKARKVLDATEVDLKEVMIDYEKLPKVYKPDKM